ncbi:MAG TPA: hypothetical protein VF317_07925 [Dermatophilaceae bacterium]
MGLKGGGCGVVALTPSSTAALVQVVNRSKARGPHLRDETLSLDHMPVQLAESLSGIARAPFA